MVNNVTGLTALHVLGDSVSEKKQHSKLWHGIEHTASTKMKVDFIGKWDTIQTDNLGHKGKQGKLQVTKLTGAAF